MNTIEYNDNAAADIEAEFDSDDELWVELSAPEDGESCGTYFDRDAVREIRDALNEALAEDDLTPSGAIRASDISLNEALIRVAAVNGVHVTFRYAKSNTSPIEVRTFVPQSVRNVGDHVTFVGQDEDRVALRSFRSDRIKGTVQVVA